MISKSTFVKGMQCLNSLLHTEVPSPGDRVRMQQGTKAGKLAHAVFPAGRMASKQWMQPTLTPTTWFEVPVTYNDLTIRIDVLRPAGTAWDLIEVKSSSRVKSKHIDDVAFQKYVCEKAGVRINKVYLMHIDTSYVRGHDVQVDKLFKLVDITDQVEAYTDIEEKIQSVRETLQHNVEPIAYPGCHSRDCPGKNCKRKPTSVYNIMGGRGGAYHKKGVLDYYDIVDPSEKIQRQKVGDTNGVYVHREELARFMQQIVDPIFLDFETFMSTLPPFLDTHAHQQLPFQYSMHTLHDHKEFLHMQHSDPRQPFIESLVHDLPREGSIIVWNKSFEAGVLRKLGERYPEHRAWVDTVVSRMVDLEVPFKQMTVYYKGQNGRSSIKKVLPAMMGKDYGGLEINQGADASAMYYNFVCEGKGSNPKEALLAYCKQDTHAMVDIYRYLMKLC